LIVPSLVLLLRSGMTTFRGGFALEDDRKLRGAPRSEVTSPDVGLTMIGPC
jgi:hypothetical protein